MNSALAGVANPEIAMERRRAMVSRGSFISRGYQDSPTFIGIYIGKVAIFKVISEQFSKLLPLLGAEEAA